jgi:hypothetical protein
MDNNVEDSWIPKPTQEERAKRFFDCKRRGENRRWTSIYLTLYIPFGDHLHFRRDRLSQIETRYDLLLRNFLFIASQFEETWFSYLWSHRVNEPRLIPVPIRQRSALTVDPITRTAPAAGFPHTVWSGRLVI